MESGGDRLTEFGLAVAVVRGLLPVDVDLDDRLVGGEVVAGGRHPRRLGHRRRHGIRGLAQGAEVGARERDLDVLVRAAAGALDLDFAGVVTEALELTADPGDRGLAVGVLGEGDVEAVLGPRFGSVDRRRVRLDVAVGTEDLFDPLRCRIAGLEGGTGWQGLGDEERVLSRGAEQVGLEEAREHHRDDEDDDGEGDGAPRVAEGGEDRGQSALLETVDAVRGLPFAGHGTRGGHDRGGGEELLALLGALGVLPLDLRLPALGPALRLRLLACDPRLVALVGGGLPLRRQRLGAAPQHPVAEHGHDRQGDEQRGEEGKGDGDGERAEELPGDAVDEGDGEEDGDRRQRRGGDRSGDLPDGGDDVRDRQLRGALTAADVLDDDDGVVDDAADGDRQRAEGEDVKGVVADHEADHRDEQRHRDRDRGDDGRAERAEEREDDEDGEEEAEAAFDGEVLDRLLDLRCLVEDRRELDVVAERRLRGGEDLGHPVRDLDDVVVLALDDGHGHRVLASGARERGLLDRVEGDVGDVLQQDSAVGGADRGVLDLLDSVDGRAHLDGHRGLPLRALPGGHDGARPLELVGHGGGDDALVVDVVGAEGDVHPLLGLSGDVDARHALNGLEFGDEVGLEAVAEGGGVPAGDGEHDDGEVVDLLGEDLHLGVGRQIRLRPVDGGPDGVGHLLRVLAERPRHGGRHHPRRGGRLHRFEIADGIEGRLQRLRHCLLDDLG
ncbi:Uncharacterised protein [Mycobacteroides abscessus subsp. abscessus]|nr:Uncharacterised protein [Mycobacteroides abscessus subsp. abscessus]